MVYLLGSLAGGLMAYAIAFVGPLTPLSFVVMAVAAFCTGFTVSTAYRAIVEP